MANNNSNLKTGDNIEFHFYYKPSHNILKKYEQTDDPKILNLEEKFMKKHLDGIGRSFVKTLSAIMYDDKFILKHLRTNFGSLVYEILKIPAGVSIDNLYTEIITMESNIAADTYLEGAGADFQFPNYKTPKYVSTFHFDYFELY